MDVNALKNKEEFPDSEVLRRTLGESYEAFEAFNEALAGNGIIPEWRYYHDGNAWLCKLPLKKKNLGWLHVYKGYFTVSCHFMERHMPQIDSELEVAESIKKAFYEEKSTGKLIPMHISVKTKELPDDLMNMLLFKKRMK